MHRSSSLLPLFTLPKAYGARTNFEVREELLKSGIAMGSDANVEDLQCGDAMRDGLGALE